LRQGQTQTGSKPFGERTGVSIKVPEESRCTSFYPKRRSTKSKYLNPSDSQKFPAISGMREQKSRYAMDSGRISQKGEREGKGGKG